MLKFPLISLAIILILFSGCTQSNFSTSPTNNDGTGIISQDLFDSCVGNSYGDDCYVVHKFGHSETIGTTLVPVSNGNIYPTPTSLTSIEILSSSGTDTLAGAGARTVKIIGLSTNWTQVEEIVNMNGTTAVALSNQYYRIYRAHVEDSGTYASSTAGSHVGTITWRVSGGGATWGEIGFSGSFPLGQSEIGQYTVPAGYHAFLGNLITAPEGNKAISLIFFKRKTASDVTAPYTSMRVMTQTHDITDNVIITTRSLKDDIPETSDIGFMANTATGTAGLSVDFEILLIKD